MKSSADTAKALADAKARLEHAQAAFDKLNNDFANGDRATIKAARENYDDARADVNEARAALGEAERAHAAQVKSEKLSRYTAARSGAAEGRKLLEAAFTKLKKQRSQLAETCAQIDTIMASNASQCGTANQLGSELGESSDAKPITDLGAHAMALRIISTGDGSAYNAAAMATWLHAYPTAADVDLAICMSIHGEQPVPVPPGLTAHEAAEIFLATFDTSAAVRESQRRQAEMFAPVHAREATRQAEHQRIADLPVHQRLLETGKLRDRENEKIQEARARSERERAERDKNAQHTSFFGV